MISIITPTFNRIEEMKCLYDSLKNQTVHSFEWIIVNDGSTDSTDCIVNEWIHHNNAFNIQYMVQVNSGKHSALNEAIKIASKPYSFIVDSDDLLTTNAVETALMWIEETKDIESLAGVAGLKSYKNGGVVGQFPHEFNRIGYIDATNISRRKNKLLGDKAEIYKTSILRQYPFPVFPGEKFLTEEVVWDRISEAGFSIRWYNKILYVCEYQNDGLTFKGNDIYIDNYQGYILSTRQRMKLHDSISAFAAAGLFMQISKKKNIGYKEVSRTLEKSLVYILLAYIVSKLRGVK